jgi:hypothetical protein
MKRKQKHISSSQWMKLKKVIKITRQYVPWQCFYSTINVTFSCTCVHHEGIWERGGTTPHIINPVLLHTMYSRNILATILSMLTFLLLHNISLAIKWNSWFFHSIHILVSLFLWVMIVSINKPTKPGNKRDLGTTWMCAVSLTLHLLYPWGKCPDYQLNRTLVGPEIWPGCTAEVKNNLTLPEYNLNYSIQSTAYKPHQHYHSSPFRLSLILNICHICKRLFLQRPLLI